MNNNTHDSHIGNYHAPTSRIATFLTKKLLKFEYGYVFNDCNYMLSLPFDFYVPSLKMCIEFQGQRHYGGEPEGQKNRDKIKCEYCAKNGIKLLTIPYRNFSKVEKIVDEFINNL